MKTTYKGGHYTLVIQDNDNKQFTFNDIVLTSKDVRSIHKTMTFNHCQVKEITAHNGVMVQWG